MRLGQHMERTVAHPHDTLVDNRLVAERVQSSDDVATVFLLHAIADGVPAPTGREVQALVESGFVDDLAVLAWVLKTWSGELDAFRAWRAGQAPEVQAALERLPAPDSQRS